MEGKTPSDGASDSIIKFACSFCGQRIRVARAYAGKTGKCPKCQKAVVIPQPAPMPADDEPLRLIRDPDKQTAPAQPIHTTPQQWHRSGPEPAAYTDQDAEESTPAPEQKPATILDVFTFPFNLAGTLHFLLFWFGPVLLGLLSIIPSIIGYLQIIIIGLYIALLGYFYLYLSNCVVAAAKDERSAPDMSFEDTIEFLDLVRRVLLIFAGTVLCFAPMILYIFFAYIWPVIRSWPEPPPFPGWAMLTVPLILCFFGIFIYPMFLLAAALFDSKTAFNPVLIISSIISTFFPYCGVVLLFCVIGLLIGFVGFWRTGILPFVARGINIYLMFIAAYILGRFFRRYEDRLHWEVKL